MPSPRRPLSRWLSTAIVAGACATFLAAPAYGLGRDRTIAQLYHTGWAAKDGAPTQGVALAQTRDGFVWVGSGSGLYRFDGVRFERFEARSGERLPSSNVFSLLATPDGGLWVGYRYGGVSLVKDGRVTNYGEADGLPSGRVRSLAIDADGTVWAAAGGLARLDGPRWRRVGAESGYPGDSAQAVFADSKGTLWVATETTIVFLPRGASAFRPTGERVEQVLRMAEAPDGSVWMAETTRAVRQVRLPGVDGRALGPEVRVGSVGLLFDREGALWITTIGDGLRRIPDPDRFRGRTIAEFGKEAEAFTQKDGLTADYATAVMEDREGDVWVATANGVDRFRESDLVPVRFPAGYQDFGLAAGDDGEMWTGSTNRPVARIRGGVPTFLKGFRSGGITCVSRDEDGAVWMGGTGVVYGFRGDRRFRIELPAAFRVFGIAAVFKDREGTLWIALDPEGLFLYRDDAWRRYDRQAELPKAAPIVSFVDASDRKWLGYAGDVLAVVDGEAVRTYSRGDGLEVGDVQAVQGRSGRVWIGGTLGLAVSDGDRFRTLTPEGDEDVFVGVSGIVETSAGDLWLNASRGVVRVSADEVRLALADPAHEVRYRLYDALDGLAGTALQHRPFPTAAEGSDGRIWFAASGGVSWIAPARVATNPVAPPVSIRSLDTESASYDPSAPVVLPAGTTSLRIEYTALCLSYPERVAFRYELEGVDDDWQDSGARRQAFYNSLRPGTYTFRVIARNEDGVWNEEGATLVFRIVPAAYQTVWFLLLCVAAGVVAAWSLYRLRVRQIARSLGARFDERLAERTRLARELHDTLLQTIQASKLVAEDALERPEDDERLRGAMTKVAAWLGRAVDEGRAALDALRTSTTERNGLAEALRQAADACSAEWSVPVTFSVSGASREMHPIVRDEIYRVASEAIRNACAHAKASGVTVELAYAGDLRVRVTDDGLGLDPAVAAGGRAGHYGLVGMRERAARIGASLTIASAPGAGTEVTLSVPGDVAFRGSSRHDRGA